MDNDEEEEEDTFVVAVVTSVALRTWSLDVAKPFNVEFVSEPVNCELTLDVLDDNAGVESPDAAAAAAAKNDESDNALAAALGFIISRLYGYGIDAPDEEDASRNGLISDEDDDDGTDEFNG